jgi:predicted phage baseplate assembly protein
MPCGCCDGVQKLTPADETNRPGLDALHYRVGTHAQFFETMKARLSTIEVQGVGSDGQTPATFRPLQGLTTRESNDPSIAMLDAWATVGDVLSFYQERIANENYLRTATERRSVLELARLVGYRLRPGVAASAYLAYTIDDKQAAPVTIPTGSAAQSVPDPDEQPQTFETSDDLVARPEWNNLQVRLKQPYDIRFDNVLSLDTLFVAGVATGLKAGDKLLFTFSADGSTAAVRSVAAIDSQFANNRTAITLQPLGPVLLACVALLVLFIDDVKALVVQDKSGETARVLAEAETVLGEVYLGVSTDPGFWIERITGSSEDNPPQPVIDAIEALGKAIDEIVPPTGTKGVTDPTRFVLPLLKPPVPQARSSLALSRSLQSAFAVPARAASQGLKLGTTAAVARATRYTDVGTQLLVSFVPQIAPSYYAAWAGAQLNPSTAPLRAVYALRSRASLFGATAGKLPAYTVSDDPDMPKGTPAGLVKPQSFWTDWTYADDEEGGNAFVDQANEAITAGSYALVEIDGERRVLRVAQATTTPRTAYGLSGQATALTFQLDNDNPWRTVGSKVAIAQLRETKLYVQSDPLTLAEEPLTDAIDAQQVPLDGLYKELTSGRWVILAGERADIDNVAGVKVAELQMISGLSHGYNPDLPGDNVHTSLVLATPLAYKYKRETLTIYGNVVKATQGGTRRETLGSGSGAQTLQSFTLKQPPLTFVAAPTAEGAQSTLHVYADNVEWHESDSLALLGPKSRGFITSTDDAGNTTVTFGTGEHGARLPTGVENVMAVYRSGIGSGGNVKAGQITTLQSRPLGVKEVINPLRASGGANKESRDLARENAPLSVMPLDRLVSVQDYEDFTRRFAGIAKALARRTTDGGHNLVYVTIAGADDVPIDVTSDLYRNLLDALRRLGDQDLPIRVDLRERKALVMSARIKLMPDYIWDSVVAAVRAALLDRFGFDRRALGQTALLSEAISVMQGVRGVAWIDVDAFGAVPERVPHVEVAPDGTVRHSRVLLSQDNILSTVADIIDAGTTVNGSLPLTERMPPNVDAWPGGFDPIEQLLRPAEIVAFTASVPDTLILNQLP